jgi:hypothetical protein
MRTFAVDNCEFEVSIKRRGIYQVPFHHAGITHHRLTSRFDLNQKPGPISAEMKSDTRVHFALALID